MPLITKKTMATKKDRFFPVELYRELLTKQLKYGELLVLMIMATYGKDGEDIYPSEARIAYDTNYSVKNIPNILKSLERKGALIRVGKSKYGTVIYRINLDALDYKPKFVTKKQKLRNQGLSAKEDTFEQNTSLDSDDSDFDEYGFFC